MANGTAFPPEIPGVTEGIPQPDPMRMLSAMLSPPSGTGMQHLMEALALLKRAGKADPRMSDQIAEAIAVLTQGTNDRSSTRSSGFGEPGLGPMPGGYLPTRGPR